MDTLRSLYSNSIYPRLMDLVLKRHGNLRGAALGRVYGDVLEVGFGTGLNLPHYPAAVRKLHALDVADPLPDRVEGRIRRVSFPVERITVVPDEPFPLNDRLFNCVVTTWTLCSIVDASRFLSEIRRVLRPDGIYVFLEHGRAQNPRTARVQSRLSKISEVLANGCRMDVPIGAVIERAGYKIIEMERFTSDGAFSLAAHMYRGVATPFPHR